MKPRPTGTVTFMFTDIESSTQRWERDEEAMRLALIAHDDAVRGVVEEAGGYVFALGGDGFACAFADPVAAVSVATAIAKVVELPVRVGLHTGTADERDGNYYGPAVNLAARVMSIGAPSHVLLSAATAELVRRRVQLVDLGDHALDGIAEPVHVFGAGTADAVDVVASAGHAGGMPTGGSFIGREDEVSNVLSALQQHRLVSLVGPGGVGKTRLAVECVRASQAIPDDIWFVELAAVGAGGVLERIAASSISLRVGPGDLLDRFAERVGRRPALLVIDNCEHVVEEAAELVDALLRRCEGVVVMSTSREPLRVGGEHVIRVEPLGVAGTEAAAVELLIDRITSAGGAAPTDREGLLRLCRRLDGVPLAIELAAARLVALDLQSLEQYLDEHLDVLSGRRSGDARHRALTAALQWSYELLQPAEQQLFDQLSVFADAFDVDDVRAVCFEPNVDGWVAAERLASLVDKSMLRFVADRPDAPYVLLETMRSFGQERLLAHDRADAVSRRHAEYFCEVAAEVGHRFAGPDEIEAVGRFSRRSPEFRRAILWCARAGETDLMMAIAQPLAELVYGHAYEPMNWLVDAAAHVAEPTPGHAAWLAFHRAVVDGELTQALEMLEELERRVGPDEYPMDAAFVRTVALLGCGRLDEAMQHAMRLHDTWSTSAAPLRRAFAGFLLAAVHASIDGDGVQIARNMMSVSETLGYRTGIAYGAVQVGANLSRSDPAAAVEVLEHAERLGRELGGSDAVTNAQAQLVSISIATERPAVAARRILDALDVAYELGNGVSFRRIATLSVVLLADSDPAGAAAIHGFLDEVPWFLRSDELDLHARAIDSVRDQLAGDLDEAVLIGRGLTMTESLTRARDGLLELAEP